MPCEYLSLMLIKMPGQPDREGPRLRPIDAGQMFLIAPRVVDFQVAVFFQPAIEVDAAAETC